MTHAMRINLGVAVAATVAALYAAEVFLTVRPLPTPAERLMDRRVRIAGAHQMAADSRTSRQVVRDLRRSGIDAWPVLSGAMALQYRMQLEGDAPLQPLAGISGVISPLCNENGPWVMVRADEHGFSNPPGQWSLARADVALIGDSYVQGLCVEPSASFPSLIRARYPATIVAGIANVGPLSELAFLREYVAPLRPRVVLWFYYEGNDLRRGHPGVGRADGLRPSSGTGEPGRRTEVSPAADQRGGLRARHRQEARSAVVGPSRHASALRALRLAHRPRRRAPHRAR